MGRNTTSSPPARTSDAGSKATPKPAATKAVTDGTYKLVRQTRNQCEPAMGAAADPKDYRYSATGYDVTDELYQTDTATPDPVLDKEGSQLALAPAPLDTSTLSAAQRQSLALAFYDGLSHAEVADHLQQPLGTVKSHLLRAQHKLRAGLSN